MYQQMRAKRVAYTLVLSGTSRELPVEEAAKSKQEGVVGSAVSPA